MSSIEHTAVVNKNPLRDNFLRHLSNYSVCIQPYLRNVNEKYVQTFVIFDQDPVDLQAYCKKEYEFVIAAK